MRLLEIELRNWRGLDHTLAGLSPRLNLVVGPNESGKSRIFQALKFGLFETHKGAAQRKQLLQSWASAESPFVRVVFVDGSHQYELQKRFLRGASVQLVGGGATVRGEDAEESLRHILGAREAGSKGAEAANRGIWPLLMVEQGDSRKPVQQDLNEDGRSLLQERLSHEIGVAAISFVGQSLISLAELEYGRYYTATGQEGKLLRDTRAAFRSAEASLAEATAALQRQEQVAQALAENRLVLSELESRQARMKLEADAARDRAEAARAAGGRVALAQATFNAVVQKVSSVQEALNNRREADAAGERLRAQLESTELQLRQRVGVQAELERAAQAAARRFVDAEKRVQLTRTAFEGLQRERRREELVAARLDLTSRIAAMEQLEATMAEARATRSTLPAIDDQALVRLKTLDQSARAAASRLQGAAVSVVVRLHRDATVDGVAHAAGDAIELHLIENRKLALGDLAEVEIRPGGGELEGLRRAAAAADRALRAALLQTGAADLEGATTIHAERSRCDQQIAELGRQVKATSAKTLGQLREEQLGLSAELGRLGPVSATSYDEMALIAARDMAEALLTQTRNERDVAADSFTEFRSEIAALRATAEAIRAERVRTIDSQVGRPTVAQLTAVLAEAVQERDRSQTALVKAKEEFLDLGGAEIQTNARRLEEDTQALVSRVNLVRSEGDRLRGSLQAIMQVGHYESKEEAGATYEQVCRELKRVEGQAVAAKRLWEVLTAERRRIVERLTEPVTLRVKPYLQALFPGFSLNAGEELDIIGLQSDQSKEPFGELSGGAQEQISLLTRIGIAEVLAAEGTLPLVLDDALVNTDPERIQRIQRLLNRAADNLQIILFSCHDVLYEGLGAEFVARLQPARHEGRH